ncbi:Similar to ankyrin repeat-containing protein, putative [Penicillium marneffei ATCC 18224]; acc. no. XP_002144344 [Pyronema omphalodes CBS 100304]|uniref:Similar to ankyrin repeat-containing protein, putative [Penicillium marneffei ATCC 18224] acc. no. XP_002144344 n=1 Tax=Pyronema omphalodes (strain CBS 100304) TaxID=1076935 RepID=U4L4B9_PYROM|nr:Similar to ankyrin repeat-containing protein, putative [Penicillium marneffei ATCC 18224]; acc. no. XP_002144344 [Pyronema omphalodes CBS 100304]
MASYQFLDFRYSDAMDNEVLENPSYGDNITLDEACQLLREALRKFDLVYLCLDALDECQEHRTPFLSSLKDLFKDFGLSRCLKLFLTGRPQVDQYVNMHITGPFLFSMTLSANKDDMLTYIKYQIEHDDSGIIMGADFMNEIVETNFYGRSNAVAYSRFLLHALQIQHVLEQLTIRSWQEALKAMPKMLDQAFEVTIQRIQNQSVARK